MNTVTKSGLVVVRHKEPSSLPSAAPAPQIFNVSPERNLGQPGITKECKAAPDNVIIATMVDLGCPRWAAEQVRSHPAARFWGLRVYCDVLDAAEGNREAKERVDYYRHCYVQLRRDELIADKPDHTVGLYER